MIRLLLISYCIIACFAASAVAQLGALTLSADPSAQTCGISDETPGLLLIYVVHVYTPGATACQFKVREPSCSGLTYLSEAVTAPYIKIGTCSGPNATGCAIAYGLCVPAPNMVLTIQYFAQGLTPNCCCMYMYPDPTANPPGIYVTDCADPPNLFTTDGFGIIINEDSSCLGCRFDDCINPVPVENTTWGSIKALFAN